MSAGDASEGTVTLAFSDVEGSTALWERVPKAMASAIETHHSLIRETLAAHGGYEVKTEGDAFMIAFAAPCEALAFAIDTQEALARADWPAALLAERAAEPIDESTCGANIPASQCCPPSAVASGLRVRIGLHTGEPDRTRDATTDRFDYYGPTVNRAARVAAAARGGQVLLSRATHLAVEDALDHWQDIDVRDLGEHRLRGLEGLERLVAVVTPACQPRAFPPPRTLTIAGVRTNLEPKLGPFVGRERELQGISRHFAEGARLVTLTASGGMGKTRLATRFGTQCLNAAPTGGADTRVGPGDTASVGFPSVWLCELTDATSEGGILKGVSWPLGATVTEADGVGQLGWAIKARGHCLLILDNVEHCLEPLADCLARWRPPPASSASAAKRCASPPRSRHRSSRLPARGLPTIPQSGKAAPARASRRLTRSDCSSHMRGWLTRAYRSRPRSSKRSRSCADCSTASRWPSSSRRPNFAEGSCR